MSSFELITNRNLTDEISDLSSRTDRRQLVFDLRLIFWSALVFITIVLQFVQPQFISLDIWLPIWSILAAHLFFNSLYVMLSDRYQNLALDKVLFALDVVVITCLTYFTGYDRSVFTLLYSVTVILGGLVFSRHGAVLLALFCSIGFNLVSAADTWTPDKNILLSLMINNGSFFALALLSGQLADQVRFLGAELTESRQSMETLKDLNQLVFDNIGTGLLVTNPFGLIVYTNEAGVKVLDENSPKGKNLSEIFPMVEEGIKIGEISRQKGEVTRFEVEYKNKKNEKLIIETLVSALYTSKQQLRGYLVLFQDLTLVKRLESEMQQKEKLAAVGQLAAGIAHEIRNPLASISGSIQLLTASSEALNDEDRKLMGIMLKEIDRLNDLISEFLDFVRPDVKASDPLNINMILHEVLEMLRFNKNLRADVDILREFNCGQYILGHHDKLKQAFLNIIINSMQAMEKVARPSLKVQTQDDMDRVVVTITDTGIGIPEETINRIFEPFHTTKPRGTGLGLAITHKIFESHGARVHVESDVGVGTKFRIEFPGEKDSFTKGPFKKKQA